MFTKQNIIHITLDVILITVLFIYVNNKNKALNDSVEQLREYTEEQVDNLNTKIDKVIKYVTKTPPPQQHQVNYQRRPPQREEPDYMTMNSSPQQPQKRQAPPSTKSSQVDKQSKKVRFEEEVKQQAPPKQYKEEVVTEREEEEEKTEKNDVEDFINSINPSFNISNILPQMNPMHFHMRPNVSAFVSTSQLIGNVRATQRQEANKIEVIEEEPSEDLEHNNDERIEEVETEVEDKREEENLDDLDILEIEKAIGLKGE